MACAGQVTITHAMSWGSSQLPMRRRLGVAELNAYKVRLMEAVLKDAFPAARAGEAGAAVEAGMVSVPASILGPTSAAVARRPLGRRDP